MQGAFQAAPVFFIIKALKCPGKFYLRFLCQTIIQVVVFCHSDTSVSVSEFFKIPDELNRTAHLSETIRSVAYSRIEEAKQRTKEELKKNWNSILKGDADPTSRRVVWDVVCELSAPQILVPEHFIDRQALIMVIDFGKLHFSNKGDLASASKQISDAVDDDDEDDDEFRTPASSPRSFEDPESPEKPEGKKQTFSRIFQFEKTLSKALGRRLPVD